MSNFITSIPIEIQLKYLIFNNKAHMENTSQSQKVVLYSFFRSGASHRVRIALNVKKVPHQFHFVHLGKGEQKTQEYKKVNPNGTIPALLVPTGEFIIESMAICEYLQEAFPQIPLLPKNPIKRAQVRAFCEIINSGITPYLNSRLLHKVHSQFKGDQVKFAKDWVFRGMDTMEALLQKNEGKYCFGDEVTLADCFFIPQIQRLIERYGVEIDNYPRCKLILSNLHELQAFKQAQPKNQPDFEQ